MDTSKDISRDIIRFVLGDTGTLFDLSLRPKNVKNEGHIEYFIEMSEGQNQGQNISLLEERYLGKCP